MRVTSLDILGASFSDAAGLGQHDNLFWITYNGSAEPASESTLVNISLTGQWFLEGDSQPDDNWWADWYARAEVYDPGLALPELNVLGWSAEYHALAGPGHKYDYGSVNIAFSVELEYEKDYALRFWADADCAAQSPQRPARQPCSHTWRHD